MKRNDPVRFVIEREEPIRASAYERRIMRPYEEPVEIANGVLHLATRDPNGNDLIVATEQIRPRKGEDARSLVRRLAAHASPDRGLGWVLTTTPDEELQKAVADAYRQETGERIDPSLVYAPIRKSVFKPEQRPTTEKTKHYGPFGIHPVTVQDRTRRIAIPTHIRLNPLEREMAQRGPIEYHFGNQFDESTLTPRLAPVTRYVPQLDENQTRKLIHEVREPSFMHRDGRRFATHALGAPERVIDAYLEHRTK